MDIRKTRTCEKCRAVVLLENVRLVPKNKETNLLVCENCCEELKKVAAKELPLESKIAPLLPPELSKYMCRRCDYSFKVDLNKAGVTYNLHCPYCGKNDQLQQGRKV